MNLSELASRAAEFVLRVAYITGLWSPPVGRLDLLDEDFGEPEAERPVAIRLREAA